MFLKKILYLICLVILISLSATNTVSAHIGSTCKPGSESLGWIVNCSGNGHAGKSYYTYNFSGDLSTAYKGYSNVGAARWNNTSVLKIEYSLASENLITSHHSRDTSTVAATTSWVNSSGHKTRWEISYNRFKMDARSADQNNSTGAHEMGHTIGLADLKNSTNQNKLMYGYSDRTAHSPTSFDITGAREAIK